MDGYAIAAELRAKAAALRDMAGVYSARSQVLGDDVASADRCATKARASWIGPRADHDLLRFCAYVNDIRGMSDGTVAVALTLHAFANEADVLAGSIERHQATISTARAETPAGEPMPVAAQLAEMAI